MFYQGRGSWQKLVAAYVDAAPGEPVRFITGWYERPTFRATIRVTIADDTIELSITEAQQLASFLLGVRDELPEEFRAAWDASCGHLARHLLEAARHAGGGGTVH